VSQTHNYKVKSEIHSTYSEYCITNSALDLEITSCMESVKLTLDLSQESLLVDTDCSELVSMVRRANTDRSCFSHLVEDFRHLFL
jgi:hypothetical protein